MNVGVILIGVIMIFAAAFGLLAMSSANSHPVVDTMGNTLTSESNDTHNQMTNNSAIMAGAGGAAGMAVMVVFVVGILIAIVILIIKGNSNFGGRGSNR